MTPPTPAFRPAPTPDSGVGRTLNDVHSRLNPVTVAEVIRPETAEEARAAGRRAKAEGLAVSVAGARHSMGGQQFGAGTLHLDMTGLNRLISLDQDKGLARVEAGITWPALRDALAAAQEGDAEPWGITQKQTGADELTLGGAVSSNIHGRGLAWRPMIQDVESLRLVDAEGMERALSRAREPELFSLAVGGYGLFGVITEVELRLSRRVPVQRVVEVIPLAGLVERIARRETDGFLLGDFQFCPDESGPGFLSEGIFSCYRPSAEPPPAGRPGLELNAPAWRGLLVAAHEDKTRAWDKYTAYYRATNGQRYWSDLAQFNHYDPDYVEILREALPAQEPGSLMISELYVPRDRLEDFMADAAADFRDQRANAIYGTIRFIRADGETFLPWARGDHACVVVNLRVTHTPEGLERARAEFRRLIDRALERGGSFFLTYHRWATREQLLTAYPEFPAFLEKKRQYDPDLRFQSEWYRHWAGLLEG